MVKGRSGSIVGATSRFTILPVAKAAAFHLVLDAPAVVSTGQLLVITVNSIGCRGAVIGCIPKCDDSSLPSSNNIVSVVVFKILINDAELVSREIRLYNTYLCL